MEPSWVLLGFLYFRWSIGVTTSGPTWLRFLRLRGHNTPPLHSIDMNDDPKLLKLLSHWKTNCKNKKLNVQLKSFSKYLNKLWKHMKHCSTTFFDLRGCLWTADATELFVNGPFSIYYIHSSVHLAPQFGAIAIQRVAVNPGHRKHLPLGPCCEFLRIIFCSRLRKAPTLGTCCQLFSIISTVSWGPCVWETPTFGPCCQLLLWRHLCLSWNTHQNTGLNMLEPGTSGEPGSSQFAYEYGKLVFLIISIPITSEDSVFSG